MIHAPVPILQSRHEPVQRVKQGGSVACRPRAGEPGIELRLPINLDHVEIGIKVLEHVPGDEHGCEPRPLVLWIIHYEANRLERTRQPFERVGGGVRQRSERVAPQREGNARPQPSAQRPVDRLTGRRPRVEQGTRERIGVRGNAQGTLAFGDTVRRDREIVAGAAGKPAHQVLGGFEAGVGDRDW